MLAQQLDPHQPAAVHHRGAARRGLRDHRPAPSTSPTRRSPDGRGRRPTPMTTASGSLRRVRRAASVDRGPVGRRSRRGAASASRSSSSRSSSSGRAPSGSAATRGGSTARSPGIQVDYEHVPPLKWRIADDLSLPHVWDIGRAFVDPAQRGGAPLGVVLAGQAAFTFMEALAGFALGGAPRARRSASCSSTRGSPSARSCRTSSHRRPCRSWPSRRSSSSRSRPTGCR